MACCTLDPVYTDVTSKVQIPFASVKILLPFTLRLDPKQYPFTLETELEQFYSITRVLYIRNKLSSFRPDVPVFYQIQP